MEKYEIIFESENILYVKINENLINDYLIMVNDPEVQKGISRKAKIYTYEQELEWVKEKLNEDNGKCRRNRNSNNSIKTK